MTQVKIHTGKEIAINHKLLEVLDAIKKLGTHYESSGVFLICGKSGLGKSTLASQCGAYLSGKDAHYYFEPQDFLNGLANAKPLSFHVLDESMCLMGRNAMGQMNRTIITAMSMIRSKRIFVCFNINEYFDIDKNIALSRINFLLKVYSNGLYDRGKFLAFFKSPGDNIDRPKRLYLAGKKTYSYSYPKANFNGTFPKHFCFNQKQYDLDKDASVDSFLKGDGAKKTKSRTALVGAVKKLKELGISIDELCEITGRSQRTIYEYLED
jgi:energy-coupling factor transporter ATP-binding protein EcfA2